MQAPGRLEKIARVYSGLAVFLLNVGILFVVLNVLAFVGVRVYNRFFLLQTPLGKYNQDKIMRAYPGWSWADLQDLLCCSLPYEYEPYTGHRDLPETRRFLTVDENGFRHVEHQGPWPESKQFVNVFFFGGSTSFGSGVRDEDTVASHLQEELNRRIGGDHVRVYNFGRVHYFSLQERALLEWLILQGHHPDFAIFLDGLNDFHRYDGIPMMTKEIKELLHEQEVNRSKDRLGIMLAPFQRLPLVTLAGLIRDAGAKPDAIDRRSIDELRAEYDVPQLKDAAQRYVTNQGLIRAIAAEQGIEPLFALQPITTYHYDINYHVFSEGSLAYFHEANYAGFGYRYLEARKDELTSHPDFLWLADMQEGRKENLYCDSVHYTSAFADEIAHKYADRMTPWVAAKVAALPGVTASSAAPSSGG